MNEPELIQRCKEQDRLAQQELFIRYAPLLKGICLRYTKNNDEAKDVLHDGFIKIFTKFWSFKEESSLKTWLSRIMINTAIDYIKLKRKEIFLSIQEDIETIGDIKEEHQELKESVEPERALELLQQLPEKYRIVISLFAIDGFTHKQIAEQLNISEGTSKSSLSRARSMLTKVMESDKNTQSYGITKAG